MPVAFFGTLLGVFPHPGEVAPSAYTYLSACSGDEGEEKEVLVSSSSVCLVPAWMDTWGRGAARSQCTDSIELRTGFVLEYQKGFVFFS